VLDQLHVVTARSLVLYFAAVGVWGVVLAVRKAEFSSAFRGALVIGVALAIVQALLGLSLVVFVKPANEPLHYLYGVTAVLTLPLVAAYISDKKYSRVLSYGLASLFIAGLAIRAITTGG
jgi:heme A synthase